jgi:hypothetical protein
MIGEVTNGPANWDHVGFEKRKASLFKARPCIEMPFETLEEEKTFFEVTASATPVEVFWFSPLVKKFILKKTILLTFYLHAILNRPNRKETECNGGEKRNDAFNFVNSYVK